jgi:outer membrane lipoprotein-sorting protein
MPLTTFLALVALGQEMDGQAVLDKMSANLAKHSSVTGVMWQHFGDQKHKQTFKIMRPHFVATISDGLEMWQVGRKTYVYFSSMKQYQKHEIPADMDDWKPQVGMINGFNAILDEGKPPMKAKPGPAMKAEFEGKQAWKVDFTPESFKDGVMLLYVDAATFTPLGFESTFGKDSIKVTYEDVVLGANLKESDFAWEPPADAKVFEEPDYDGKLLQPGTKAPDFTLKTPEGKDIKLSEKLKEGNGVLINFWFYG